MARRMVLWRHGQTSWNVQGRVQGKSDIPLNEVGHIQARDAAERLAALQPDRIVTSDLSRARATAQYLSDLTGVPAEPDERVREMNFGEREGMTMREAWSRFPKGMQAWADGDETRIPGSETHFQAGQRAAAAMREFVEVLPEDSTLVITAHGTIIRTGVCAFLGIAAEHWRAFGGMSNCSWAVLEESAYHGRTQWRLSEWNAGTLPEPVLSDDKPA